MNEDKTVELLREVHNVFIPKNSTEQDLYNKIKKHLEQIEVANEYEQEEDTRYNRKKGGRLQGTIEERRS